MNKDSKISILDAELKCIATFSLALTTVLGSLELEVLFDYVDKVLIERKIVSQNSVLIFFKKLTEDNRGNNNE